MQPVKLGGVKPHWRLHRHPLARYFRWALYGVVHKPAGKLLQLAGHHGGVDGRNVLQFEILFHGLIRLAVVQVAAHFYRMERRQLVAILTRVQDESGRLNYGHHFL